MEVKNQAWDSTDEKMTFVEDGVGGTVQPVVACPFREYAHPEIAHDGDTDECYGEQGYDSSNDDTDGTAPGCRDADGVLTGSHVTMAMVRIAM